jgi:flagellar basal-body rod protein FlgG
MMRSLWTAASGMISQQHNVDNIANNLANVNTAGFKKERMEFKTLLYETMRRADLDPANRTGRPVNLQVGHGVRPIAVSRMFTMGNLQRTDSAQDFAIEGPGFFVVQRGFDDYKYTRDGTFKYAPTDMGLMLVTSEGYWVLGTNDEPIIIPLEVPLSEVLVAEDGSMYFSNAQNEFEDLGFRIQLVQFPNVQGLEAVGSNLYAATISSGQPLMEADGEVNTFSRLIQGSLEMSNVQVAEEMVNLIVAQRAYDLNSKAITTSDDMLNTANNLKRS